MEGKLLLKGNDAYAWIQNENLSFIGYFFDENQNLYRNQEAIDYISNELKTLSLEQICRKINGLFSLIIVSENEYTFASDAVNFFPIFYKINHNQIIISDRWETIIDLTKKFDFNKDAVDEFETAGFVLCNETLDQSVYKTNANQILRISNLEQNVSQYQNFITDSFFNKSFEDLAEDSEKVLMQVGEKLVSFLNGKTAVVPLSGGYDSRLIVSLLKKMKYEKVICFTYGKNNPEVAISKKVAEELGYDWHFVDFTKINIEEIQAKSEFRHYLDFAANGYSMPYLMEYFAVSELKNNNLILEDSIFLPGHSGDFLGGSYMKKTVKNHISFHDLPSFIEPKYFVFTQKSSTKKNQIQKRLQHSLSPIGQSYFSGDFNMSVEEWDIQEKLAKFIFHSSQVFLYFGFEVYFPLWDKELVNFYRRVPFEFRENKKLYDHVLEKYFFQPQNISFDKKELSVSAFQFFLQKVKDAIRYFFPWKMVLKRMNNADWPYYQMLTKNMKSYLETKRKKEFSHFKTYNAVICAWYIEYIQEKYKF